MGLGEKIKAARLEAGLSQRQLCGDTITRNMLSQIENGSASPSMATLQYLAGRLGKSVSFFLQEQAVDSQNTELMHRVRQAYAQRQTGAVLTLLRDYHSPDPLFDQEAQYLFALCAISHSEHLLQQGDAFQAATLLEQIRRDCIYYRPEQEQLRRQLLCRAYPLLEEIHKQSGNFEQAYSYACKLRDLTK